MNGFFAGQMWRSNFIFYGIAMLLFFVILASSHHTYLKMYACVLFGLFIARGSQINPFNWISEQMDWRKLW